MKNGRPGRKTAKSLAKQEIVWRSRAAANLALLLVGSLIWLNISARETAVIAWYKHGLPETVVFDQEILRSYVPVWVFAISVNALSLAAKLVYAKWNLPVIFTHILSHILTTVLMMRFLQEDGLVTKASWERLLKTFPRLGSSPEQVERTLIGLSLILLLVGLATSLIRTSWCLLQWYKRRQTTMNPQR